MSIVFRRRFEQLDETRVGFSVYTRDERAENVRRAESNGGNGFIDGGYFAEEVAIGARLAEFFALVRLMLATWKDSEVKCPICDGHGCPCGSLGCSGHPECLCDKCLGWGALVDWQEALRRAGWDGPEVSR